MYTTDTMHQVDMSEEVMIFGHSHRFVVLKHLELSGDLLAGD